MRVQLDDAWYAAEDARRDAARQARIDNPWPTVALFLLASFIGWYWHPVDRAIDWLFQVLFG